MSERDRLRDAFADSQQAEVLAYVERLEAAVRTMGPLLAELAECDDECGEDCPTRRARAALAALDAAEEPQS